MWGKLAMTTNVLTKLDCWMKHLGLHHINGRDPDGIRVRPVEGYEVRYKICLVFFCIKVDDERGMGENKRGSELLASGLHGVLNILHDNGIEIYREPQIFWKYTGCGGTLLPI